MSKIYAFLADGLEEVECLAVVDILRRAKLDVTMVSITGHTSVTGSHNITITADALFEECDFSDADMLFLPGGMPGTNHLAAHQGLTDLILSCDAKQKYLAAICAAPSIYGGLGLLSGKHATCYPGFENKCTGALIEKNGVVTDGHFITARGLGFAIDLGLELVRVLAGEALSTEIRDAIQHP